VFSSRTAFDDNRPLTPTTHDAAFFQTFTMYFSTYPPIHLPTTQLVCLLLFTSSCFSVLPHPPLHQIGKNMAFLRYLNFNLFT